MGLWTVTAGTTDPRVWVMTMMDALRANAGVRTTLMMASIAMQEQREKDVNAAMGMAPWRRE